MQLLKNKQIHIENWIIALYGKWKIVQKIENFLPRLSQRLAYTALYLYKKSIYCSQKKKKNTIKSYYKVGKAFSKI